jgi:hypothetical protein
MTAGQPQSRRVALGRVAKTIVGLLVLTIVGMVLTPMGPDSPRMIPFMLLTWFWLLALAVIGVMYLLAGRR